MTESNWLNSPTGTLDTEKAFCASCHHGFPSRSLSNTDRQVSRNQFIKLASYFDNGFSDKNLDEDVAERSKARKTDERKNFRFHVGSGTRNLEESGISGAPIASPNDGHQTPTCFVSQPLCLCCRTAVKKYLGTSREAHDCFASECKLPKDCLNRESVFLVDSWQGTKSQCKCSQEILPFNINPTNACKENRAAISKRRECDLIQDSSQINHGWKILDGNHKCC
ncbi:uncharacterized protein LOC123031935 isoform X2 [Varanus komodoensis]|uniref:uncharacterized protein LOC123031935 isoform X2 n=1 Tax=Varanus komodoensis TaxID=61221 RepID=UPI001CF7AD85|nr:uncharacterized protein LOC123031935 isoform X2 [Varanus komodoensis]